MCKGKVQRSINYHKENKGGMCLIIRALAKGLAIVMANKMVHGLHCLSRLRGLPVDMARAEPLHDESKPTPSGRMRVGSQPAMAGNVC